MTLVPTRHAEVRWGFLMENVRGGMRLAGLWEPLHVSSARESCPLQCIPIANALFCVTVSWWHCLSFTAWILTPTVTPSMWLLFGNRRKMVQGAEKNAFCCEKKWPQGHNHVSVSYLHFPLLMYCVSIPTLRTLDVKCSLWVRGLNHAKKTLKLSHGLYL